MSESKPAAPPAAYVNFLQVGSQANEVFLSFGQLAGQADAAHLVAALVTSPTHAKAMSRALAKAVATWEERNGVLPEPAEPSTGAPKKPPAPARAAARARGGSIS